ncbi:putative cysteine--tRNA ligase [Pitangus sulphuratus]|nr:putative cysteine--tRNA ligase [Pitangus sulphuratus]
MEAEKSFAAILPLWYSCGPTVYDQAHLGHACSYVRFDIIRRIMTKFFGIEVIMVMGITDIDDKIIKRSNEMNVSPVALARFYEEDFKQDMAALKVLPPTVYMRVTDNIPQIISFIKTIIANGQAYTTSQGNVYFDVKSWGKRYGVLTAINPDTYDEAGFPEEIFVRSVQDVLFAWQIQLSVHEECAINVEFSDKSMDDAKNLLQATSSFITDANAYIKGQLVCDPIREDILWEQLANTKVTVKAAFADDFDTSRAVAAIMDLIHHGNRQLKAVTKDAGSPRSSVVYGSIISYVEGFFNALGMSFGERQVAVGGDNSAVLSNVLDELVRFRTRVRHYALALPEAAGAVPVEGAPGASEPKEEQKEKRKQLMRERKPLLEACDSLREDLAAFGIHIKGVGEGCRDADEMIFDRAIVTIPEPS